MKNKGAFKRRNEKIIAERNEVGEKRRTEQYLQKVKKKIENNDFTNDPSYFGKTIIVLNKLIKTKPHLSKKQIQGINNLIKRLNEMKNNNV